MGNNLPPGSEVLRYKTKTGIPIEYIFYDLKGKTRYPNTPSQAQVSVMFEMVLNDVVAMPDQIAKLREMSVKYKHRFSVKHKRMIAENQERSRMSASIQLVNDPKPQINKKIEIDERLKVIQQTKGVLKIQLLNLDKYISEKRAPRQFIQINGVERILACLGKQNKNNQIGSKTNFSNQIDILRFIKSFSSRYPRFFFPQISEIKDYPQIIMKSFHPVHVGVTAYVLSLIEDYAWKVDECNIVDILKKTNPNPIDSYLKRFGDILEQSQNILMVYYNLKFINQLLAAVIDQQQKNSLQQQRIAIKYEIILDNIKSKLQQNYYKVEFCSFPYVHSQVYQYATKSKKQSDPMKTTQLRNTNNIRETLNIMAIQNHLLNFVNVSQDDKDKDKTDDENQEQFMVIYLSQSDKNLFNKYLLDTFAQIQSYVKLQCFVNPEFNDDTNFQQEMNQAKMDDVKINDYVKHIRTNCVKNDCSDQMLSILKNLQYLQKSQWNRIDRSIKEELGLTSRSDQFEQMKKIIEEKDATIKKLYKENQSLKEKQKNYQQQTPIMVGMQMKGQQQNKEPMLQSRLSQLPKPPNTLPNGTLPPPPPPPPTKQNTLTITSNPTSLPPPPNPLTTINNPQATFLLPPPPPPPPISNTFNNQNTIKTTLNELPPPPSTNQTSFLLPPPPPPPPISNTFNSSNSNSNNTAFTLPLPPPPPPSNTTSLLPPPPPPPMNIQSSGLPPPPLSGLNLLPPPPPSLPTGGFCVPPPPPLSGGLPVIGQQNSNIKVKQKKKPTIPLKTINYAVLSYEKIKDTIWQQVDDQKILIDYEELQTLFAKAQIKQKAVSSTIQLQSPTKKQPIKLLGADRWRNVEIILTKLKIPQGKISQALRVCSGKYAVQSTLQSISKALPLQDQVQMMKMYSGSIDDLGKPQKFFLELIQVPHYRARIDSMIFSSIKEQLYTEINSKLEELTTAFTSLKQNYRLHYVLQIALAIGNYLNGTTLKGGAWGFKLQSIQRMQEVKSSDNKINAAFYVIKEVWKKYAYPIFDKQQVEMYSFVSKMPVNQLGADIGQLRKYARSVNLAMQSKNPDDSNDMIGQYCQEIKQEVDYKVAEFQEKYKKLQQAYKQCAKFYCEDPTKSTSDQIGKKIFKCILFISNTQKTLNVMEEKWKKEEARKAIKTDIKYVEEGSLNNSEKKNNPELNQKKPIRSNILPQPPNLSLPKPPQIKNTVTKQQRLKQFQKSQQQRQKKALQEVIKKRITKMVAMRTSKLPSKINMADVAQQIDFLKGV